MKIVRLKIVDMYYWKKPLSQYPGYNSNTKEVNLMDYVPVYYKKMYCKKIDSDFLETIFRLLDGGEIPKIPEDYHSYCANAGDLITFKGMSTAYIVDICGFKEVKILNKGMGYE